MLITFVRKSYFFRCGTFDGNGIDCIFIFSNGSMHTEYFVARNNYYIVRKPQKHVEIKGNENTIPQFEILIIIYQLFIH